MAWDKNDWIAAILILVILSVAVLAALYALGIFTPSISDFYRFR